LEAQEVLVELRQALTSDEHVIQLAPALKAAQAKAVRLLTKQAEPPRPLVDEPKPPRAESGKRIIEQGTKDNLSLSEAAAELNSLQARAKDKQQVRVSMRWLIEEGGSQ
jgi:hypothetical protein